MYCMSETFTLLRINAQPTVKKIIFANKLTIRTASSSKGFHSTFEGKCIKTLALKERSKGEICKESPGQV